MQSASPGRTSIVLSHLPDRFSDNACTIFLLHMNRAADAPDQETPLALLNPKCIFPLLKEEESKYVT
jgi:hypothetical protein